MLAWALWLALAMIRWLPWAWTSFSAGGLWRAVPKKAKAAGSAIAPAARRPSAEPVAKSDGEPGIVEPVPQAIPVPAATTTQG